MVTKMRITTMVHDDDAPGAGSPGGHTAAAASSSVFQC